MPATQKWISRLTLGKDGGRRTSLARGHGRVNEERGS